MIAYLLLSFIALILVILFVPLNFCGQGRWAENMSGEIELAWAGGLIATRWRLNQPEKNQFILRLGTWVKPLHRRKSEPVHTSSRLAPEGEQPSPLPPKSKPHPKNNLSYIKPFLSRHVIRESLLFLRQLWKSLQLRFDLTGEYGTEDPALTGMLAAGISALNGACGGLHLQSNFECNTLDLQGEVRGRIIPAQLIWECGRFLSRSPIRKIWWPILNEKITKK